MNGSQCMSLAYKSILSGDYESAERWFEQAISYEPGNASFHYRLSFTYARSGKLAKAVLHAETAADIDCSNPDYKLQVTRLSAAAIIHQVKGQIERGDAKLFACIPMLEQAVKYNPLASEAHLLLGIIYGRLQQYGLAVMALREAVQLNPDHAAAQMMLNEYELYWAESIHPDHLTDQCKEGTG